MDRKESPWLRVREGAVYAKTGPKMLYGAIKNGRLRAARIGGRREIRLKKEWIDAYLESESSPK